jgi:uncharacterized protein (UPF0548 family)
VIVLTRDPRTFVADQLRRSCDQAVTYPEIGRTQASELPPGYNHDRVRLSVGEGDLAWERARAAIRLWRAHAHAGITISPADAPVREGTTIIASRNFGPMLILAPCRVVRETDEPSRFGFAYGTLPGHPASGEEAFHVVLEADGGVTAEIVAFSRPADLLTRAASPLARQVQKAAIRRYLEGIKRYVAETK